MPCLGTTVCLDSEPLPSSEGSSKSSRSQEPQRMCLLTKPKPLSRHGYKSLVLVLFEKRDSSERAGEYLSGKSFKDGYAFPSGFPKWIYSLCLVLIPAVNHKQSIALCD